VLDWIEKDAGPVGIPTGNQLLEGIRQAYEGFLELKGNRKVWLQS